MITVTRKDKFQTKSKRERESIKTIMILLLLALFIGVTSTVSVRATTPETAPLPLYRIEVGTQITVKYGAVATCQP